MSPQVSASCLDQKTIEMFLHTHRRAIPRPDLMLAGTFPTYLDDQSLIFDEYAGLPAELMERAGRKF